jgi:hypothetical protein
VSAGCLEDAAAASAPRGNGYTCAVYVNRRDRNTANSPNQPYDTLNLAAAYYFWYAVNGVGHLRQRER